MTLPNIDEFVCECIKNSKENGYSPHKMTPRELAEDIYDCVYDPTDDPWTVEEYERAIKRIRQKDGRKTTGNNP